MKQHLTDDTLRTLQLEDGRAQLVVFDTELKGFGVVVGQRTTTFIVNRRIGKKLHREALGAWTGRGGVLARFDIINHCFRGGDTRHREEYETVRTSKRGCDDLLAAKRRNKECTE